MNLLVTCLQAAGVVHLLIAAANVLVPRTLKYRENLATLSPIVRQVFVLHSVFILLVVVGFGMVCLLLAPRLAERDPLAKSVAGFMAVLWLLRFILQLFYVDPEVKRQHRLGNFAYTLAILGLGGVLSVAALGIVK